MGKANGYNTGGKKKRYVAWKEQFEVHEVESWKAYNILGEDDERVQCKCTLF